MTREIDPEEIADESLSYDDAKYLQDRGKLPKDYPMPDPPDEVEDDSSPEAPKSRVTPLEDQEQPNIGRNGGIVDDEDAEDYDVGWNNDQRRAELSKRELSVDGDKAAMMARLIRSDNDESLDEDYA